MPPLIFDNPIKSTTLRGHSRGGVLILVDNVRGSPDVIHQKSPRPWGTKRGKVDLEWRNLLIIGPIWLIFLKIDSSFKELSIDIYFMSNCSWMSLLNELIKIMFKFLKFYGISWFNRIQTNQFLLNYTSIESHCKKLSTYMNIMK